MNDRQASKEDKTVEEKHRRLLHLWRALALSLKQPIDLKHTENGFISIKIPVEEAKLLQEASLNILKSGAFGIVPPHKELSLENIGVIDIRLIKEDCPSSFFSEWISHWQKNKGQQAINEKLIEAITGKKKLPFLSGNFGDWFSLILCFLDSHDLKHHAEFIKKLKSSLSRVTLSQNRKRAREIMRENIDKVAIERLKFNLENVKKKDSEIFKSEESLKWLENILNEGKKGILDKYEDTFRKNLTKKGGRPKNKKP